MLKRPSSRRKGHSEQIALNLVPVLDTLVTLIAFLLFTMSFLNLVTIESPVPRSSSEELEQKLLEKPLQLTLTLRDNEAEIWSPFEKIPTSKIPNASPGQPDLRNIHETLVQIKKRFPTETHIVIVPSASLNYDTLIAVMDNMRGFEPTDSPVFAKNPKTGIEEQTKTLFPDVIFGNLLGES
ncbi:biopolymer transporter ExbD [Bdellovibrionota bacterium FG-1]